MSDEFNYEEFEEKLEKLSHLIRLRGHGYKIEDEELEEYFEENNDAILEMLAQEYSEGDKDSVLDTLDILGYSVDDLSL